MNGFGRTYANKRGQCNVHVLTICVLCFNKRVCDSWLPHTCRTCVTLGDIIVHVSTATITYTYYSVVITTIIYKYYVNLVAQLLLVYVTTKYTTVQDSVIVTDDIYIISIKPSTHNATLLMLRCSHVHVQCRGVAVDINSIYGKNVTISFTMLCNLCTKIINFY